MQEIAIEYGKFTLSAGDESDYHYDGKRVILRPDWAVLMGRILADIVLKTDTEAIGGMAIGAVPIAQAVSMIAWVQGARDIPVFIIRKEKKAHGRQDKIASAYRSDGTPVLKRGTRVAIVDDVVTKGGSIDQTIEEVEGLGCEVVLVAVLVERHEGGGRAIRDRGYNFQRLFYTDPSGKLMIDEALSARYTGAIAQRVSP
jgi:orotate phosphoribosyltransferase